MSEEIMRESIIDTLMEEYQDYLLNLDYETLVELTNKGVFVEGELDWRKAK